MSALAALRAATGDLHREVDERFGSPADLDDYATLLGALAPVFPPLEQAVATGLAPDLPTPAPRTHLLRADLAALGAGWPEPARLPVAPGVGAAVGAAVGAWYVLAGSRLGGVALARRLESLDDGLPLGFLRGETDPLAEWRGFRDCADRLVAGEAVDEACLVARAAFISIGTHRP